MEQGKILFKLFGFSLLFGWIIHQVEVINLSNLRENSEMITQASDDDIKTIIIEDEVLSELRGSEIKNLPQTKTSDLRTIKTGKTRKVVATYYNPVPEQCWGDPLVTASGKRIDLEKLEEEKIKWIAVSRDLLKVYKFGDKVRITCEEDPSINGIYEIADTMHERFENKIDLLWPVGKTGKGRWKNVQIDPV